ncbi:MAG: HAMP domain-containing protein [Desulfobacteraceae bacterium]|nr:HAMP domain-containing protein [Desulfobacteraceae bacterium]
MAFHYIGVTKDVGIEEAKKVLHKAQEEKLQSSVHTIATALSKALEGVGDNDEKIDVMRRIVYPVRFEADESGYFFIYSKTVNVVHPIKKQLEGKDLGHLVDKNGVRSIRELYKNATRGGGFVEFMWNKPGAGDILKLGYSEMIPGTEFWIGTGVYLDNITAYENKITSMISRTVVKTAGIALLVTAVVFFLITQIISLFIVKSISNPLKMVEDTVKTLASGKLNVSFDTSGRDDISELGKSLNAMVGSFSSILSEITTGIDTLVSSSTDLSSISEQMSQGAGQTFDRSNSVAASAEEMSSNMNSVAAAMEQASANAHQVATATEDMTSTIGEIARNADTARGISREAVDKSKSVSTKMVELGNAAQAIGKVTEAITEISEQTNLLALNATIEAARAGEAGKGFAVVANEIKELARQTAGATHDIKSQIDGVQNTARLTNDEIDEISSVINGVDDVIATIAAAVEEQSSATAEIAGNISQTSQGIREVNGNINQTSGLAGEIAREISLVNTDAGEISNGSGQVRLSAESLNEMAAHLSAIAGKFVI